MGSLLSKHKHNRVTEQDRAILQLKIQRDELNRYTKRAETQLEKDRMLAKKLVAQGKKEKALLLLKKKKYLEKMMDKAAGQLSTVESLIHDIEFAQVEMRVLDGLSQGNQALKKMHQIMSLDDAERIMAETREAIEYQQELNDLVSAGLTREDNEGLEDELNRLLKEGELKLPEVPDHELPERPIREPERSPRRSRPREPNQPMIAT